jgi:hypothetical protein
MAARLMARTIARRLSSMRGLYGYMRGLYGYLCGRRYLRSPYQALAAAAFAIADVLYCRSRLWLAPHGMCVILS